MIHKLIRDFDEMISIDPYWNNKKTKYIMEKVFCFYIFTRQKVNMKMLNDFTSQFFFFFFFSLERKKERNKK